MYYGFSVPHDRLMLSLCTPVEILPKFPSTEESFTVIAVWDTGSTFTAINPEIAKRSGIIPNDDAAASGLGGSLIGNWLNLPFRLPGGLLFSDKRTMACELPCGIEMVIGMDVIITGDFHISHSGGKTLFSFIHPSLPEPINLETRAAMLNAHT
jgi:hypothetical protein